MLKRIKQIIIRLFRKQKCFYINGPEALPPPLSKEREQEITQEIRNGDFSNRDLLITHNLRLVVYIAKSLKAKQPQPRTLFQSVQSGL